jgi:hypothetical protein
MVASKRSLKNGGDFRTILWQEGMSAYDKRRVAVALDLAGANFGGHWLPDEPARI